MAFPALSLEATPQADAVKAGFIAPAATGALLEQHITRIKPMSSLTRYDYDILAQLIDGGTPLVLAFRRKGAAFALEQEWQKTEPTMRNYFRWLNGEGDMLAVVTGHVYDVFDFDVQNGGSLSEFLDYYESLGNSSMTVQAISATPSGGYHLYVRTLAKRKQPIARGVDYQGLRGIAFVPPSRKLSKHTGAIKPYRWLEYSPGGDDDGQLIYDTLSEWPNHRPVLASRQSTTDRGFAGLTKSDVRYMTRQGIPEDMPHDDTLRDVIWSMCIWAADKETAKRVWQQVVDLTPPKGNKRPFEERDFERHWRGAERKLRGDV